MAGFSLMNGLSSLGSGVAEYAGNAGLQAQKAALQQQAITLTNQLQHESKTAEIAQQGGIQSGITGQEVAGRQQVAETAAATELAATKMRVEEMPPEEKILLALGVDLPGLRNSPAAGGGGAVQSPSGSSSSALPPASGAVPSSGVTSGGITLPSGTGSASAASTAMGSPLGTGASPDAQNIMRKALGLSPIGSEAYNRQMMATDVSKDPDFKDRSPGEQASEVESRLAVAEGKLTDPKSRMGMAKLIANYQIDALTGYALNKPGGPETMALVQQINPNYTEARFKEVRDAMVKFGGGPDGDRVRFDNVSIQHLGVLDQTIDALDSGVFRPTNAVANYFKQQFGSTAPTDFNAVKQIAVSEVTKATSGGVMASADRDRLVDSLSAANSADQLKSVVDRFRGLMVGQLVGLKRQYEDATGFTDGPFAFANKLDPDTIKTLGLDATGAPVSSAAATKALQDAPPDPADRKPGGTYALPGGRTGVWNPGKGWGNVSAPIGPPGGAASQLPLGQIGP